MISKTMHGNFTGVQLDQITSLKISKDTSGFTRTSFRVIGGRLQKLELILQLKTGRLDPYAWYCLAAGAGALVLLR